VFPGRRAWQPAEETQIREFRRGGRRAFSSIVGFLVILLLAAEGCTTHVVSSNPHSVLVESWWLDAAKAQEMADAECAKYSRVALMRLKADLDETNYVFECVAR
jgi:hypothetical protein